MSEFGSFLDYVRHGMEDNIYNFTKDGKCSNCGNCCTDILPMSDKEIRTIRDYVKRNHIKEHRQMAPTVNPIMDMTCPFRNNEERVCDIYPVRPKICKSFICNSEKRAKRDRELYKQTRQIVSVRETFYGT